MPPIIYSHTFPQQMSIIFFIWMKYVVCSNRISATFERYVMFALSKRKLNKIFNDTKLLKVGTDNFKKKREKMVFFSYFILQAILPTISK